MRNFLHPFLQGLALTVSAQFAPPGAVWTYDQEGGTYAMSVVGDTLLNGRTCSIIEGSSPSACWQSHAYTYQSGDTVFWSDDQYLPQFFELYRWNAQVGESWDVWVNGPVTVTYTVLATGTTTVNGQTLRTLDVEATDTQQAWAQSSGVLIEHIGDTLFMFPWLAAFCDVLAPWPLRCYTDDDLGTFMRPGVSDCDQPPPPSTVFAPVGATWTYTQHYAFAPDSDLFVIECVGDTSIQGIPCSVLESSGGISECMGFREFVAATGDSVIFFEPHDSTFRTLYVLGLTAGMGWETIVVRGYYDQGNWITVFDTLTFEVSMSDTVIIDGIGLRRSTVTGTYSMDWPHQTVAISGSVTERLGHSAFMFPWIDGACDLEHNNPLRCYTDPDITWLNPQLPQCALAVGMEEQAETDLFTVRPSMVTTGEVVHLNGPSGTIEVLDAGGRRVLFRTTTGREDLEMDGPGLYLVRCTTRNGRMAQQRIVVY